jgi:hypothetical protein
MEIEFPKSRKIELLANTISEFLRILKDEGGGDFLELHI